MRVHNGHKLKSVSFLSCSLPDVCYTWTAYEASCYDKCDFEFKCWAGSTADVARGIAQKFTIIKIITT